MPSNCYAQWKQSKHMHTDAYKSSVGFVHSSVLLLSRKKKDNTTEVYSMNPSLKHYIGRRKSGEAT